MTSRQWYTLLSLVVVNLLVCAVLEFLLMVTGASSSPASAQAAVAPEQNAPPMLAVTPAEVEEFLSLDHAVVAADHPALENTSPLDVPQELSADASVLNRRALEVESSRRQPEPELPAFTPAPNQRAQPVSVPTPAPPSITLAPGTINVIFLGSDRRPGGATWRTDAMILASINPSARTVRLVSIPRDLWVSIPGRGPGRINTADFYGEWSKYPGGGPALVKQTIQNNLGLPVQYYVRVDMLGFVKIVDTLGGVTVQVDCGIRDQFPDPFSPTGWSQLDLAPGVHHLDGKTALLFSRSRLSTSDHDRTRRQQQILKGLWEHTLTPETLPKIPQLWAALKESFQTDLGVEQVLSLARLALQLRTTDITSRYFDRSMAVGAVTPQGAQVLVPTGPQTQKAVADFLAAPASAAAKPPVSVEVWNATGDAELGQLAEERLKWAGLIVVGVSNRSEYAAKTTLLYGREQQDAAVRARQTLGLATTSMQPASDLPASVRVILGRDFPACPR